jgi:ABC-type microcin C transport system permease subunit YejE
MLVSSIIVLYLGLLASGIMALLEAKDKCIVTPLDLRSATLNTEDTMLMPVLSSTSIFHTGSSSFTIAGNRPSWMSFSLAAEEWVCRSSIRYRAATKQISTLEYLMAPMELTNLLVS